MVRRRWFFGQFALVGVLAALALPGNGSAYSGVSILLTANGPSPAVQTLPAGMYPIWINQDTVTHTVTFADGRCSTQVAPGGYGQCGSGFSSLAGDYSYTVDGTTQAKILVTAEPRTVTLRARSHSIGRGSLMLHGRLFAAVAGPPSAPEQPVIVLARHDRMHPFHRIAVVRPRQEHSKGPFGPVLWHLRVHPRARTIYIVEANSQPSGGQYWQRAWSRPFRVRVGR